MPDFAIVNFQINATDNQDFNNSKFNHSNVKNIKFINERNEVFPRVVWELDILNNKSVKMYDSYTSLKRVMCGNTEMYYDPLEFTKIGLCMF
jgi:hypothetical protein